MVLANARGPRGLRRFWKGHTDAILQHNGLVLVRHTFVHDGAVAVPLHVGLQPLMRSAPANSTHLLAWQDPLRIATEFCPEVRHIGRVHQIHERITQTRPALKIDRQVEEVVLSLKTLVVKHRQQHCTRVVVGQIAKHNCCALLHGQITFHRLHGDVDAATTFLPASLKRGLDLEVVTLLTSKAAATRHLAGIHLVLTRLLLAVLPSVGADPGIS
mmetsp:Transcript_44661/g.83398  ORF Transcript_44661/g.83398 Transcript_44661/m.83398 type:complete len:215 (-) Transcript_44661:952-1596(-)